MTLSPSQNPLPSDEDEMMKRIVATILLYAIRGRASAIRIQFGHYLTIFYSIRGQWREQMKIPPSARDKVVAHITGLCEHRQWDDFQISVIPLRLSDDHLGLVLSGYIAVSFSPGEGGEDILLRLEPCVFGRPEDSAST